MADNDTDILEKLNVLITGQTALTTRISILESQVSELNRTVRGSNGDPGLVTEIALIRQVVSQLPVNKSASASETDDLDKQAVTWRWVVDKLTVPVITAIAIWLLLSFVPQVFGHISVVP